MNLRPTPAWYIRAVCLIQVDSSAEVECVPACCFFCKACATTCCGGGSVCVYVSVLMCFFLRCSCALVCLCVCVFVVVWGCFCFAVPARGGGVFCFWLLLRRAVAHSLGRLPGLRLRHTTTKTATVKRQNHPTHLYSDNTTAATATKLLLI